MIQATCNSECLHGAMGHGRFQKLLLPFGAERKKGSMIIFASCLIFSRPLVSVPELEAVLKRAARLRVWIPSMSGPRPHTEASRRRSVGIESHGLAVVHCKAWASSLRVASSRADMGPMYPSTDKAYILKSHSLSTRPLVDSLIFFCSLSGFLPRCCPTMDAVLRSDHGAKILGVLDYLHLAKFFTVRRHPI